MTLPPTSDNPENPVNGNVQDISGENVVGWIHAEGSAQVTIRQVSYHQLSQVDEERARQKAEVAPGQTVDVAVGLVAPALPGSYRGEWILRNASGTSFGKGANGIGPVWVAITMISTGPTTVTVISLGAITGTAFSDNNANDIPDTGEVTQGLTVTLYDSTGSTPLTHTATDTNGRYTFPNLSPGTYYVKWVVTGCSQPQTREEIVNVNAGDTQFQDLSTFVLC